MVFYGGGIHVNHLRAPCESTAHLTVSSLKKKVCTKVLSHPDPVSRSSFSLFNNIIMFFSCVSSRSPSARLTGLADLKEFVEATGDLRRSQTHHHLSYARALLQVRRHLISGGTAIRSPRRRKKNNHQPLPGGSPSENDSGFFITLVMRLLKFS